MQSSGRCDKSIPSLKAAQTANENFFTQSHGRKSTATDTKTLYSLETLYSLAQPDIWDIFKIYLRYRTEW